MKWKVRHEWSVLADDSDSEITFNEAIRQTTTDFNECLLQNQYQLNLELNVELW